MTLFPVFLKLHARHVLVVGGGRVAASKLRALLDTGARVTVVAPAILEEIAATPVSLARRPFSPKDLNGVWFVVAAATPDVNREVALCAEQRGIFVNAVDDVQNASAYLGGVLRREGVTVAVSTDGAAPALSGLLREGLDALLPTDLDAWMACARDTRRQWRVDRVPMAQRRPLLLDALVSLYRSPSTREP
jgi:uroporphyrin-III C-methyltransferase / precorrin-2 dehydrogenase / sirohydrochlorin ferrochelatase